MSRGGRGHGAGSGRHRAREVALQVLFALDLGRMEEESAGTDDGDAREDGNGADGAEPDASTADRAFDRVAQHFDVPAAAAEFARELVREVRARRHGLDEMIGAHARNWRVARMPTVDRNVLRLAVYELRWSDTPVAVVIDEAVDLARRFGGDASPAFVNGVLDAVAREIRAA